MTADADMDVGKGEHLAIAGWNTNWYNNHGNHHGGSSKN